MIQNKDGTAFAFYRQEKDVNVLRIKGKVKCCCGGERLIWVDFCMLDKDIPKFKKAILKHIDVKRELTVEEVEKVVKDMINKNKKYYLKNLPRPRKKRK